MKYISGLLFIFIALTGCTSEIAKDCPLFDNVILHFRYTDDAGKDIFSDNINQVDVVIFTEEGDFYAWEVIPKALLDEFQGTVLAVKPGKYMIVCWGNASSDWLMPGTRRGEHYCMVNPGNYEGSALHYAPSKTYPAQNTEDYSIYTISAPAKGMEEKTYDFMPTHWRINVYVSGYKDIHGGNTLPDVQLTEMREGYDFLLSPLSKHVNYYRGTEKMNTSDGEWAYAGFNTAYFNLDDDIRINVCSKADGATAGTIFLNEFLRENNRELAYGKVEVVDVLITFTDLGVMVSMPDWDTVTVVPDL